VRIPQETGSLEVLGEEKVAVLENSDKDSNSHSMIHEELAKMPEGKILVVDDVYTNLEVMEGILSLYGIKTELVESGEEAVSKVKAGNVYHIIFMDHMMPGMDGIEATRIIREFGYNLPIIALTANAVTDMRYMFIDGGFTGFMSKPIDIEELSDNLTKFVHGAKL